MTLLSDADPLTARPYSRFKCFGVVVVHFQDVGDVAREVVAGNGNGSRKQQRIAIVDRHMGRLRADVDQHTPRARSSGKTAA